MIPKKGKDFPERAKSSGATVTYAAAVGGALRAELGDTHQAVKRLARWTGANERTVKNWLAGRAGPSGAYLVSIVRNSDAVLYTLLRLAGRHPIIASAKLIQAHQYLSNTVKEVGLILDET